MQRWVAIAAALVAACGTAFGLVDPHDETNPERCRSCHTSGIHAQDRRPGDSHLLQESIQRCAQTATKGTDRRGRQSGSMEVESEGSEPVAVEAGLQAGAYTC